MLILGIETSCDDTCVGILNFKNNKVEILANIIHSQIEVHQEYGGVFPNVAIREHKKNITKTLLESLKKANLLNRKEKFTQEIIRSTEKIQKIKEILKDDALFKDFEEIIRFKKPKIDYLSVTIGPGLDPCLWVGVNFTKALSIYWDIPIIPVNHIEGHIAANWLSPIRRNSKSKITNSKQISISNFQNLFPAICLIVSGGHTQLILMEKIRKYKIIGETKDDAAGECFDKVSKILGLGYPGGPAIAAEAAKFSISNEQFSIKLPRPMKHQKNYDFSFSGLKTAVFYDFKSRSPRIQKSEEYVREVCYKTQEAIIDTLLYKTFRAVEKYNIKTIILGGGVSANNRLRSEIKKEAKLRNLTSLIPEKNLSVDNGIMIAMAAYLNQNQATKKKEKIRVDSNLKVSTEASN